MFGRNKKIAARYAAIRRGIKDARHQVECSRDPYHGTLYNFWPSFDTPEENALYHKAFQKVIVKEMVVVVSRISSNIIAARVKGLLPNGD